LAPGIFAPQIAILGGELIELLNLDPDSLWV
jgi:hypothetical protein